MIRRHVLKDEVGANRKTANRNRGTSRRGTPATTHLNMFTGGRKVSALGVFCETGFLDIDVIGGGFTGEEFLKALDRSVVRALGPPNAHMPPRDGNRPTRL